MAGAAAQTPGARHHRDPRRNIQRAADTRLLLRCQKQLSRYRNSTRQRRRMRSVLPGRQVLHQLEGGGLPPAAGTAPVSAAPVATATAVAAVTAAATTAVAATTAPAAAAVAAATPAATLGAFSLRARFVDG